MYISYWKQIFDYKGYSKLLHLFMNLAINILVLILILVVGLFVPITWENALVDIYYIVLIIMILPTLSMIVRVIRNYSK